MSLYQEGCPNSLLELIDRFARRFLDYELPVIRKKSQNRATIA
ncbi:MULTISPECIES: hypothetical protein [Hungatella]|nr:hypothetical protein [Hungatella hathewayi]